MLGAVITEFLGWQWIFWVNVPLGLAVLPLVLRKVPESTASPEPVDLIGLGLLSGIVLATVLATTPSLSSAPTIACLGAAALGVLSLVRRERRHPNAIIPTDFLHDRDLVAGNIAGLLTRRCHPRLGVLDGPVSPRRARLQHSDRTCLVPLPWTGTFPIVAPLAGRLIDRIGSRPVLVGGLFLQALGLAWIGIVVTPSTAYAALIVPLLLAGIGGSAVFPAAQTTVLASVPETRIGRASGLNAVAREFGGVLGIGVVSAVFVAAGDCASPDHVVSGIQGVLLVGAFLALVGARRNDHVAPPTTAQPTTPGTATAANLTTCRKYSTDSSRSAPLGHMSAGDRRVVVRPFYERPRPDAAAGCPPRRRRCCPQIMRSQGRSGGHFESLTSSAATGGQTRDAAPPQEDRLAHIG